MQRSIRAKRDLKTGILFTAPFLLFFIVFKGYPLLYGIIVSFFDQNSIRKLASYDFIGITNYVRVLQSNDVRVAFYRTLQYSLLYVVLTMGFAFFLAILLQKKFPGRTIVRTLCYIPYVTNLIAVGIVWKYLLNPFEGPINSFLRLLGINEGMLPQWLTGTNSALPTTAFINTWVTLAFSVITLLAALQEIPASFYEVASLEGCNALSRLRFITLPALKPTIGFLLMMNSINSFKNYTVIMALTNGGPGNATNVSSFQIYRDAFNYYKFSFASAHAVLLTLFILLLTLVLMQIRKRWEA